MIKRPFLVCSVLAVALACGDKKDTSPKVDNSPLTEDELCALYGGSNSNGANECSAKPTMEFVTSATAACLPGALGRQWAQALLDSANNQRITIDWAKARSCNAQGRALIATMTTPIGLVASNDWRALMAGDCAAIYTANVDTGGTCVYPWDCKNHGDTCASPAPYTSTTFTCTAPGKAGDVCDGTSSFCGDGMYCNGAPGTCVASPAVCNKDVECGVDGTCVNGTCATVGAIGIGGGCHSSAECKDVCSYCNIPHLATSGTCALVGGVGAACTSRSDCAEDLGCNVDGTCGVVAANVACSLNEDGTSHAVCDSGLTCMAVESCSGLNEADCTAKAPHCMFDGACNNDVGTCTTLPASGACLPSSAQQRCADHFSCVASDTQCHPNAETGEACDNDNQTAPYCDDGLACGDGLCAAFCDSATWPCPDGQYCTADGVCKTVIADACDDTSSDDDQCGPSRFCASPDALCASFAAQATCAGNSDCAWNGVKCNAAGGAIAHCRDRGHPGDLVIGFCETENSDIGYTLACDSTFCFDDGASAATCVVAPRGCLDFGSGSSIPLVFAFGMVSFYRRRKRRG